MEIQKLNQTDNELQFLLKGITPGLANMPITILQKTQKLEFEAVAILGQGKQHAKFSPCLAYYTTENDKDFMFFIESFGQLTTLEILENAISIFDGKLDDFENGLKGEKRSKLDILKKIPKPKLKLRK